MARYAIIIYESERGWGSKYERWDNYDSLEEAKIHFAAINAENKPGPAPDYYIQAEAIEKKDEETGKWFTVYP